MGLVNCCRRTRPSQLKIGGLEVGISGLGEILEKAFEQIGSPDEVIRARLLSELKARNYVPPSAEDEYMRALWAEFRRAREERLELLGLSHKDIPREEIPWFPKVDENRCSGCSSCVEFCTQGVFSFDGKSHVIRPYACIVGNTSCKSFCPEKAISFPTMTELKAWLADLRKKHGRQE